MLARKKKHKKAVGAACGRRSEYAYHLSGAPALRLSDTDTRGPPSTPVDTLFSSLSMTNELVCLDGTARGAYRPDPSALYWVVIDTILTLYSQCPGKTSLRTGYASPPKERSERQTRRPEQMRLHQHSPSSHSARSNLTFEASAGRPSNLHQTSLRHTSSPDAVGGDYMAGSRRSPLLRDQWRAAKDPEDRERDRDRDTARDRGRDRHRDPKPHRRHWETRSERRTRSPPPSRRGVLSDRDPPRRHRDPSPDTVAHRRPLASRDSVSREERHPGARHASPASRRAPAPDSRDVRRSRLLEEEQAPRRHSRRDDSPTPPPSKRKRTRSPSPRAHRHHHHHHHHHSHHHHSRHSPSRGDSRDRSRQPRSRRHLPDRSRSPRQSPIRDKEKGHRSSIARRDPFDADSPDHPRSRRSRSAERDRGKHHHSRASRSSHRRDESPRRRSRSASRQSFRSIRSRESASPGRRFRRDRIMNSTRPIQSVVDDSKRSPSPLRPIPSFDADNSGGPLDGESRIREAFPMHGMRASDVHGNQRGRGSRSHGQYSNSPQYVTPTSSYHGSPSGSPYSNGRGGWSGQPSFHGQHG